MAKVLYQFDIMTPSPDVDAEAMVAEIRNGLPEGMVLQEGTEIKPMFFGIKAAICQFVCPEEEGIQDQLENYLNDLVEKSSIGEMELSFTTRL